MNTIEALLTAAVAAAVAVMLFYCLTEPEPAHAPDGLFDAGEVTP